MELEHRSQILLELLLNRSTPIIIEDICKQMNISRRTFYYVLDVLNEWLNAHQFTPLENIRGVGLQLSLVEKAAISRISKSNVGTVYTQDERVSLLLYILLANQENLHSQNLIDFMNVSRNTLFNDLKTVREKLIGYDLDLQYVNNEGYQVLGDVIKIRTAFIYTHWKIIKIEELNRINSNSEFIVFNNENKLDIYNRVKEVEKRLNTSYVVGTISALSSLLNIMITIEQEDVTFDNSATYLLSTPEFDVIKQIFPELSENEMLYISLHLLGARTQIPNERMNMPSLSTLAVDLVNEFERISAYRFREKIKLIKQISDHLSVSYFRYKFGIYHGNPLTDHIKQEYDSIFKLTNIACDLIRNELELPVHEGEVALITLHFSSYLERKIFDDTIVVLDIVCPSGISTSNMLYTELINLHSFIKVNKVMGIEQYHNEGSSSEYIVSTIPLEQEVKHIVVNPILTNADKKNILNTLNLQVDTPNNVAVDDLMLLINPYIKPGMKEYTKKTLLNYFSRDETYKSKRLGMLDILYNENIIVSDEKVSWKDAVKIGSSPLINNKSIEPSYIEAMINNTIKFGPYMVLENGYVLMHANYVDGVNNLAISFTKFNHSIKIKNKQFNKLIILAPIDEKKHIDIMKDLMLLFTDEDIHHKLDEADSSEAIKEVLKELSNDKES